MERAEAIEVIKKNFPDSRYTSLREALETLIPELRESEDEKIRKWIYNLVSNLDPQDDDAEKELDEMKPLALAWLEKQKDHFRDDTKMVEQQPAEVDESTKRLNDNWMKQHFDDYEEQKPAQSREEILHQLFQSGSITLSDYLYLTGEQKPAEKEITLTSFEGTLNTFLFDFANSPIEDCEPKEYIKKHSAEILKAAYKELNVKLQQDIFEARQEGIRDGYEVAKAEQKPAEIAPNQFDGITYGMQGYSTEKPAEWNEDWREEDIQTRFAFYTYKDEDGVLYLSNVFVEEASRNHGFGTKILAAAEKVAETIGATTISLKVKQDSPANAWYRKNGYGYVAFEDGYDWLEKNLEYMKPNKQEWSEKDEEMYINVASSLRGYACGLEDEKHKAHIKKELDWFENRFKSLRPQPKQEWSEEDEKMRNRLIDRLNFIAYRQPTDATTVCMTFESEIAWLKSLRPSWKPNEDQMEALLWCTAHLGGADHRVLAELYEHLKKL